MEQKYNPNIHHRRSIRLPEYDYSQEGMYFITLCTHERVPRFGTITDGEMELNDIGRMVGEWYHLLEEKYPHIVCREYVIMPNHFHCIIQIKQEDAPCRGIPCGCPNTEHIPQRPTLGQIIGGFKSITSNECLRIYKEREETLGKLWQRNYYEHIIRDQRSYEEIVAYIIENPIHWRDDQLYV